MTQLKKNDGFVLPLALTISVLITLATASFLLISVSNDKLSKKSADSIRAYYLADAGLADAFVQLRNNPQTFTLNNNSYQVGGSGQNGSYNVTVTSNGAGWATYTITSQGTYNGVSKTLTLKEQTATYSRYGYLSGTEIDPVWGGNWFITGMISTGPTSTNGQFNMYGTPVFTGVVSQVNPAVNYWNPAVDNPDYQQGLVTGTTAITMPNATVMLNSISGGAQQAGGLYLTGNSTITFVNDGTMNVTNAAKGWVNQNMPIPSNNALFVHNGTATVKGVLKGQVTLGSDKDISVGGNLIYKTDPRTDSSSTDLLAMVAQHNVQIADLGASRPHDIEVDGYIVAMNQFLVQNFWTFAAGNLVQYGGLTTTLPGGLTGLFDPGTGQVVFGYNQLQYFDTRLQSMAPQWFPPMVDQNNRTVYNKVSFSEL